MSKKAQSASTVFFEYRHTKPFDMSIFYGVKIKIPLGEEGHTHAYQLGQTLREAEVVFDSMYRSDLLRVGQTLAGIGRGMGISIKDYPLGMRRVHRLAQAIGIPDRRESHTKAYIDKRLRDVSYPALEGKRVKGEHVILNENERVHFRDIESYALESSEDTGRRGISAVYDIAKHHPNGVALLGTHSDVFARTLAILINLKTDDGRFPSHRELSEAGLFPDLGELALFKVSNDGKLLGEILRNPSASEIRIYMREEGPGRKEKNYF